MLFYAVDADLLAGFVLALELDDAINLGKECEILTLTDVGTRVESGSTLAHENVACADIFTCKLFNAPAFGLGISSVV